MNEMLETFQAAMAPPERDPSVSELARWYSMTRQAIYKACKKHQIDPHVFESPQCLYIILREKGTRSPLRTRLSDPAEQARISNLVAKFYADQLTQRISSNRKAAAIAS